jgi:hypothetical protein
MDAEEDEDEVRNELFYQAAKESHGSVINLISEDVNNVMMFFWMGHYTWAIPLKVNLPLFGFFSLFFFSRTESTKFFSLAE